ncbi:MAG TPA: class I SAM-dependent methyltransferase [Smithellaceae bacterium]|nr:class I SAM-dependent methyltransferase [Smithellaceae bacterium]HOG91189.1 class I SAM-dependent methyltransferase [Smithella sp.]HPL67872.1 class I SAM-dependent methyltransferase [Smithellaceae bacterium]
MQLEKRDFDREAMKWDENPGRVKLAKDIYAAIIKAVSISPETDALDYGCGTGLLTLLLQPHVRHITGTDSSQGMLDMLNQKIDQLLLPNVATKFLDLEKDALLEGRYNLITCSMTLHHAENPASLIEKLYAGLLPGGSLCIADLDSEDGAFHSSNDGVFHFGFERSVMTDLFDKIGLDDVNLTTAAQVTKKDATSKNKTFPIFLITGKRPL